MTYKTKKHHQEKIEELYELGMGFDEHPEDLTKEAMGDPFTMGLVNTGIGMVAGYGIDRENTKKLKKQLKESEDTIANINAKLRKANSRAAQSEAKLLQGKKNLKRLGVGAGVALGGLALSKLRKRRNKGMKKEAIPLPIYAMATGGVAYNRHKKAKELTGSNAILKRELAEAERKALKAQEAASKAEAKLLQGKKNLKRLGIGAGLALGGLALSKLRKRRKKGMKKEAIFASLALGGYAYNRHRKVKKMTGSNATLARELAETKRRTLKAQEATSKAEAKLLKGKKNLKRLGVGAGLALGGLALSKLRKRRKKGMKKEAFVIPTIIGASAGAMYGALKRQNRRVEGLEQSNSMLARKASEAESRALKAQAAASKAEAKLLKGKKNLKRLGVGAGLALGGLALSKLRKKGMKKKAYVTGARIPDSVTTSAPVSYEQRRKAYMRYLDRKALEDKTPLSRAAGTGAAVGGVLGALSGMSRGRSLKSGAVGAAAGALVGAAAKSYDDSMIDEARSLLRNPDHIQDAITSKTLDRYNRRERMKDYDRRRRHAEIRRYLAHSDHKHLRRR